MGVRLFWHQVGTKSRGKVPCGTALQIPPFAICKGLSIRVNVLIPSGMGTPVKRYMS